MLEIRPNCENCGKSLPNDSEEAYICTFECTYCKDCATNILQNVCPNCGGGFEKRPTRPSALLKKYPVSKDHKYKPVDLLEFKKLLQKYKDVWPTKR